MCVLFIVGVFALLFYTNFRSGDARCKGPSLSPKAAQKKNNGSTVDSITITGNKINTPTIRGYVKMLISYEA